MRMRIRRVFVLAIGHLFFQFQELRLPEMSIHVVLDQGPILGFETVDCTPKEGCFLSPRLLKEALAPVGIIGAEVVNDRVFVLIERQRVFDLGSSVQVVEIIMT